MAIKRTIKRNFEEEVITIYSAFMEFIEVKQTKNLSGVSIRDYEKTFHFFMNHFGFDDTTPLHVLDAHLFRDWTKSLLEKDLKPASINRYLGDCRVFVRWCIENAYLYNNIKITLIKGQDTGVKAFPDDELLVITEKPVNLNSFTEWRTWTVINWILATGNRCSTVVNVKIGDIDFKNKEIMLRHTKNKKAQVIPLSSTLETIIKDYIRTWRYRADNNDYLFPNTANEYLSPEALAHSFAKYCKNRGCSHTNIHGLRHSFALNWVRNGGSEFKLQKILGHSTLDMTRRYVALATADLKEDYECFSALDRLIKTKKPRKLINRENRYV